MDTVLAIVIGMLAYLTSFAILTALAGALFRIPIERVQFGLAQSFRIFRIGATDVRLSPFLLGSYVKFSPPAPDKPFAPWPVRCAVALIGPFVSIGLCALLLGNRALDEALIAWPQMWAAATDFSTPFDPAAALAPWLATNGLPSAAAVVAIKIAMFNLLPLPFLNGGAFLIAFFEGLTGRYRPELPQLPLILSLAAAIAFVLILIWRVATAT